jgi:hypothetical protein
MRSFPKTLPMVSNTLEMETRPKSLQKRPFSLGFGIGTQETRRATFVSSVSFAKAKNDDSRV